MSEKFYPYPLPFFLNVYVSLLVKKFSKHNVNTCIITYMTYTMSFEAVFDEEESVTGFRSFHFPDGHPRDTRGPVRFFTRMVRIPYPVKTYEEIEEFYHMNERGIDVEFLPQSDIMLIA